MRTTCVVVCACSVLLPRRGPRGGHAWWAARGRHNAQRAPQRGAPPLRHCAPRAYVREQHAAAAAAPGTPPRGPPRCRPLRFVSYEWPAPAPRTLALVRAPSYRASPEPRQQQERPALRDVLYYYWKAHNVPQRHALHPRLRCAAPAWKRHRVLLVPPRPAQPQVACDAVQLRARAGGVHDGIVVPACGFSTSSMSGGVCNGGNERVNEPDTTTPVWRRGLEHASSCACAPSAPEQRAHAARRVRVALGVCRESACVWAQPPRRLQHRLLQQVSRGR